MKTSTAIRDLNTNLEKGAHGFANTMSTTANTAGRTHDDLLITVILIT